MEADPARSVEIVETRSLLPKFDVQPTTVSQRVSGANGLTACPQSQTRKKLQDSKEPAADDQIQLLLREQCLTTQEMPDSQAKPELPVSSEIQNFEIESLVNKSSVISRVNWHLLPMFFCLGMLCSIDRANLSFAALQLNHDLNFSDSVYGFGSGVFFITYALFAVPSTFVCAKMGPPAFLGGTLVLWGCVAALFAAMRYSWHFYVLRLMLGFAESGAYPGMWFHMALFYDEREMVLAYTIVSTASALSGAAGAPIAAALLAMDGVLGLQGWQWLFLLEGLPAIALGLIVFFFLPASPAAASFLAPEECEWLVSRKAGAEGRKGEAGDEEGLLRRRETPSGLEALLQMLREWRVWLLAVVWGTLSAGMDGLVFWIPLIIKSILYGEIPREEEDVLDADRDLLTSRSVHTALLSSIPFTSAAVGMVAVAYSSKRTGERHWHITLPMIVATAAVIVLPFVESHVKWLALAMLTLGAVGIWSPHGPLLTWPAVFLDGTAAASGYALMKMMGALAAFAGNAAMGELHEKSGSFAFPMLLLGGLLGIGAILTLSFREPGHKSAVEVKPFFSRLQNRMGFKRSRSDPTALNPKLAFSGTLSTIRENVPWPDRGIGGALFEMPSMQTQFDTRRL